MKNVHIIFAGLALLTSATIFATDYPRPLNNERFENSLDKSSFSISHDPYANKDQDKRKNLTAAINTPATLENTSTAPKDKEIADKIRVILIEDRNLSKDGKIVRIDVINGVVTLNGQVANAAEKSSVEAHAKSVKGVKEINNKLEIAK